MADDALRIDGSQSLSTRRRLADQLGQIATVSDIASTIRSEIAGRPVLVARPPVESKAPIVHAHGGHSMCSLESHARFAGHLAQHTSRTVVLVGYRRTPEHPWTAAVDDLLAVAADVSTRSGVVLSGDSAGGRIATVAALHSPPTLRLTALLLLAPWLDAEQTGASMVTNADSDESVTRAGLDALAREVFETSPPADPRYTVSPLDADVDRLPPLVLQVGADEVLLDDSRRLAARVRAAGGDPWLDVVADQQHAFYLAAGLLPAADDALARLGSALDNC